MKTYEITGLLQFLQKFVVSYFLCAVKSAKHKGDYKPYSYDNKNNADDFEDINSFQYSLRLRYVFF